MPMELLWVTEEELGTMRIRRKANRNRQANMDLWLLLLG
jgi:hypothetical protein